MIHVSCAILIKDNKVLVCQRSSSMSLPLKWEFPGGKIEAGESKENCLKREIKEELHIDIDIIESLTPNVHHYSNFSITLYPFICEVKGGELKKTEHAQILWVDEEELMAFDWAEADIPIVKEFLKK